MNLYRPIAQIVIMITMMATNCSRTRNRISFCDVLGDPPRSMLAKPSTSTTATATIAMVTIQWENDMRGVLAPTGGGCHRPDYADDPTGKLPPRMSISIGRWPRVQAASGSRRRHRNGTTVKNADSSEPRQPIKATIR